MKPNAVILGGHLDLVSFVSVARHGALVHFSAEYEERVNKDRELVESWIKEGKVMYGVTTGFGALSDRVISPEEAAKLQENIVLTHSVSVGDPLSIEQVRATMLMVLQNLGQGVSGVRMEVLKQYAEFLNRGLTPWAPARGSVGYLSPEAHIALVLIGQGKAYYEGELLPSEEALKRAGLKPMVLSSKEGLALVSGTTGVTGIAALSLYDMLKAAKSADIIAATTHELLRGQMNAFDERLMSVRPHEEQGKVAKNVRRILADSEVVEHFKGHHLQDALSLRCVPQQHGSARQLFKNALSTIEVEINSCCDNPIIWAKEGEEAAISGCNADSAYVGMAMDSAAIGAIGLGKISERRNNRLIDESLSGYPWFCIGNPGLNSGLMIPQYTQAGLLNEMRMLGTPATMDNTPTCGNQEDYVAMGYNGALKCERIVEDLEYILAIELLSAYEDQQFLDESLKRSKATSALLKEISEKVPVMKEDIYIHPYIEYLKDMIHSGRLIEIVENVVGELD